ncbi:MAG: UpxY family transcription antiterminator [Flavobacteriaceae bacterium]|tara:strand:- start:38467 stop:38928 length:462 start_codon:yes stop_codon:yes gene_type:complete
MNWYVLHTKPRSEKKVEEKLLSLGINAYCPTQSEIRPWSDRKKRIHIPVLPSMVLVNIEDKDINRVFECPGVVSYMFWLGKRAVVSQSEIDILKKYLDGNYNLISSNSSSVNVGDDFKLPSFNNEKGIVSRISKNNIWIYLKSIGCSVKLKLA